MLKIVYLQNFMAEKFTPPTTLLKYTSPESGINIIDKQIASIQKQIAFLLTLIESKNGYEDIVIINQNLQGSLPTNDIDALASILLDSRETEKLQSCEPEIKKIRLKISDLIQKQGELIKLQRQQLQSNPSIFTQHQESESE